MYALLDRLSISVRHLLVLDNIFRENHNEFRRIDDLLEADDFQQVLLEISRELYSGGKQPRGGKKLSRQMILGDIIQYIFTGRAYYYAVKSTEHLSAFLKLILYCVNQLLIFDSITVNPSLRKAYIEKLEQEIDKKILYEKDGDAFLANELKNSETVLNDSDWNKYDLFVDSLLPKTLGCPKELIIFAELIRIKKGLIIPLLLIQRIFGDKKILAPPDFILMKENKEIYGIEVGYAKEGQSREFSIRTSIPTFAVDLKNHMHNRCPKCGEFILYCDNVIRAYSDGSLANKLDSNSKKYLCNNCPDFNDGDCIYANYYGKTKGNAYNGKKLPETEKRHYHSCCVKESSYDYRRREKPIIGHKNEFFAQIPEIEGIEDI